MSKNSYVLFTTFIDAILVCHSQGYHHARSEVCLQYHNCNKLEYSIGGNEHIMIGQIIIMLLFLNKLMLLLDN